jgi:hypothetical protein
VLGLGFHVGARRRQCLPAVGAAPRRRTSGPGSRSSATSSSPESRDTHPGQPRYYLSPSTQVSIYLSRVPSLSFLSTVTWFRRSAGPRTGTTRLRRASSLSTSMAPKRCKSPYTFLRPGYLPPVQHCMYGMDVLIAMHIVLRRITSIIKMSCLGHTMHITQLCHSPQILL